MTRVLFKTGLVLFLITIVSKLLGFTREILIARNYGTSALADAYYVALTPTMLAITFSFTLSSVFLPLFVNFASDNKKSNVFTNNVLFLFLAIFIVAYTFVIVFTHHFIHVLAPGLTEEAEAMAITLVRILFPLVFIVIAIQIYTLMLNTFHDYMASAASILPNNLIIIAYLWLFADKYGIVGFAVTTLVAYVIQLVILYLLLKGHKYKVIRNVELWNSNSKKFLLLLYPIMISSGFNQWNSVVDRVLASGISEGAIGENCNIGQGVTIGIAGRGEKKGVPQIGNKVYIAPGAKIIGKIIIGNNVMIGANSVVTKDVPDNAVVAGVPAKIISYKGWE